MSGDQNPAVAGDPFWSVVRRRHPDLDIVLLPPEAPPVADSGLPERSPAPFATSTAVSADDHWTRLVGHGTPRRLATWIPGPSADSVRCTVTLTLDDASATAGIQHLREAETVLAADGWRVFTPPTGMPRIMADRPGEIGDEHLLFGYAPETGRLFLRLASTGLPVGADRAHDLIGTAA